MKAKSPGQLVLGAKFRVHIRNAVRFAAIQELGLLGGQTRFQGRRERPIKQFPGGFGKPVELQKIADDFRVPIAVGGVNPNSNPDCPPGDFVVPENSVGLTFWRAVSLVVGLKKIV